MFTPKRSTGMTPAGSTRVTRSQSLKTAYEQSPRMSFGSALNSSLVFNDSLLESYKTPLPLKITELISQSRQEELNQFNANILPNGHVVFITDKRLYIWKLRKSLKNIQSNELPLPSSKSKIKASCVYVECYNNKTYVAMCVTPEGTIRYWPSIFNESSSIDSKCDLATNDEAAYLMIINENSYLMITNNGQLWSITLENSNNQICVVCRAIKASSGMLSCIGRRMTSLIFGGYNGKNAINFKSALRYRDLNEFYILCDKMLQKWKIGSENNHTLTFQSNMEEIFHEKYINQFPDYTKCSIMFQDASITKNSVYILTIIEDDDLKFAIGEIDTHLNTPNIRLKSFNVLNYKLSSSDAQNQFHIIAMENQHAFYIFNQNTVISFTGPMLEIAGETKFQSHEDRIAAHGKYESDYLLFSLNNGILRIKDTNTINMSIQEESLMLNTSQNLSQTMNNSALDSSNLSFQQQTHDFTFSQQPGDFTITNISKEQTALLRLKAAFQLYLRKEERESETIISELIGQSKRISIDNLCVELSEKIIDDVPAHDPRWAENHAIGGKSFNSNLIIIKQLNGKLKMHEYYISFLKAFDLWKNFKTTNYNGREIETNLALEEHGEKLKCAIAIREQLFVKNQDLISSAIELTIKQRETDASSKLMYPHDLFYRKVSKIDEVFQSLSQIQKDVVRNNSNEHAINYLIDATQSFIKLLKTAQTYRLEKQELYRHNETSLFDYIRWTFLSAKKDISTTTSSVIDLCINQHKICIDFGLPNCNSVEKKAILMQYLYDLDSLIFEEYEIRLKSMEKLRDQSSSMMNTEYQAFQKSYTKLKSQLIDVYIKNKSINEALKLSEQYMDFYTLALVCEMNDNSELLINYLEKFGQKNFSEFIVTYFAEKKKLSFLFREELRTRPDISKCLDNYSTLSWIKDIKNEKYSKASETLEDLALNENDIYAKRKTLLSLGKLSLIASEQTSNTQAKLNLINRRLRYLEYIETLPEGIIKNLAPSKEMIPTIKPDKLIDLYVTHEDANEFDFKKALELLNYINDDTKKFYTNQEVAEIKLKIFVYSILVDNWQLLCNSDDPEAALTQTKFYKTILLLKQEDENISSFTPSVDDLITHHLLAHFSRNRKFLYLLKACYELLML